MKSAEIEVGTKIYAYRWGTRYSGPYYTECVVMSLERGWEAEKVPEDPENPRGIQKTIYVHRPEGKDLPNGGIRKSSYIAIAVLAVDGYTWEPRICGLNAVLEMNDRYRERIDTRIAKHRAVYERTEEAVRKEREFIQQCKETYGFKAVEEDDDVDYDKNDEFPMTVNFRHADDGRVSMEVSEFFRLLNWIDQ